MLGAIAGDMIGSVYEWNARDSTEFPLFTAKSTFTDDTVLTVAVAHAILDSHSTGELPDYQKYVHDYARRYPGRGYGGRFRSWILEEDPQPYNSFGNGSAMRVSPVGFAFSGVPHVLAEARRSAEFTHNHPEGIKGAEATALAILLARQHKSRDELREEIAAHSGYDLGRTVDQIRPDYSFDVTCQGSVPEAIIAFLDSTDFESAIRNAISLGGDADTQACIAGGIAEAFYGGVPASIAAEVRKRLPSEMLLVVDDFYSMLT